MKKKKNYNTMLPVQHLSTTDLELQYLHSGKPFPLPRLYVYDII